MNTRKSILRQTLYLIAGEAICIAAMVGLFALLGYFNGSVVLGGVLGGVLAVGNFFFMAISANAAADRAENQDVKGGKAMVRMSYCLRLLAVGVLLFVFAKSGRCNVLALACPLFFVFPILAVLEFFRKTGGSKT